MPARFTGEWQHKLTCEELIHHFFCSSAYGVLAADEENWYSDHVLTILYNLLHSSIQVENIF